MSPEDQLLYESHNRVRQTGVAVAAGVLLMIATVVGLLGPHAAVSEETLNLIVEHRRATLDLLAALLNAIAEIGIGVALLYLWRCAKARSDRSFTLTPIVVVVGVVLAVVTGILYDLVIAGKASTFVTTGAQTYDEANHLTSGALLTLTQIGGQLASLLIAVGFVLVSVQALRVGLLPRMMAYVGFLCGVLFLFPLTVIPIVQLFWFVALALLLSGRWPDGLPPAWRSGRAEPWPSSAEMRARRMATAEANREQRASRRGGGQRAKVSDAAALKADGGTSRGDSDQGGAESTGADGDAPARSTARRKRKRRR